MGTWQGGVYVPSHAEVGWDDEVSDFLTRSSEHEINVRASVYGGTGDGSTDDTAAIQGALDDALIPSSPHFGKPVRIPWTPNHYKFGALDWHEGLRNGASDIWIKIIIEGELRPQAPLVIPARRLHIGGRQGSVETYSSFSDVSSVDIDCRDLGTSDALTLSGGATSVYLENIRLTHAQGNGIVIEDGVCRINMRGVGVVQNSGATVGSCVKQTSMAFGLYMDDCSFDQQADNPAVDLEMGIVSIDRSFFAHHGVRLNGGGDFCARRVLAESLLEPFMWIDSTASPGFVNAVTLDHIVSADNAFSPSSLIRNVGTTTYGVDVTGCDGYDTLVEAGSATINGLRHWHAKSTDGTLGATSEFLATDRFGRLLVGSPVCYQSKTFTSSTNTPNVGGTSYVVMSNASGPQNVDSLEGAVAGQILHILFTNGNTVIVNNTNHKLAGAVNFTGTTDDILTLIHDGTRWHEVSRSVN